MSPYLEQSVLVPRTLWALMVLSILYQTSVTGDFSATTTSPDHGDRCSANSTCQGNLVCRSGRCFCSSSMYYDGSWCVDKVGFGAPCDDGNQCQTTMTCLPTQWCGCYSEYYYDTSRRQCQYRLYYLELCDSAQSWDNVCMESDAACIAAEDGRKRCLCDQGHYRSDYGICEEESSSESLYLGLGIGLGCGLLVIVAVAIAVVVYCKRRRSRPTEETGDSGYVNVTFVQGDNHSRIEDTTTKYDKIVAQSQAVQRESDIYEVVAHGSEQQNDVSFDVSETSRVYTNAGEQDIEEGNVSYEMEPQPSAPQDNRDYVNVPAKAVVKDPENSNEYEMI